MGGPGGGGRQERKKKKKKKKKAQPSKVPAFGDLGRAAKDVLSTGYNVTKHSLKLSAKTAGPDLTFNTALTDQVTGDLKASYKGKGYTIDSTFASSQKVTGSVSLTELLPGLKTTLSATVPDQRSG